MCRFDKTRTPKKITRQNGQNDANLMINPIKRVRRLVAGPYGYEKWGGVAQLIKMHTNEHVLVIY